MTHRLNLFLLALALLLGVPAYLLLLDNPSRDVAPHALRLADLRRLADSVPGPRPETLQVTFVGWDRTPGNLLAAGAGIKRRLYTVMSFRLDAPGSKPIVIDTGMTGDLAKSAGIEGFNQRRQRRIDADMAAARAIIATDESPATLAGLARLANDPAGSRALAAAWLNQAQLPAATPTLPWPEGLTLPARLGPGLQAVAPGVVVIPTRAPTPGSQMIYVHLADGREYLLAGPVAPFDVNASELRTRSRLLDWWEGRQDRAGAMRWLVTLRAWQKEAPKLYVVPGHDGSSLIDKDRPSGLIYRD